MALTPQLQASQDADENAPHDFKDDEGDDGADVDSATDGRDQAAQRSQHGIGDPLQNPDDWVVNDGPVGVGVDPGKQDADKEQKLVYLEEQ
jgi:hypothetical protein